MSSITHPIVISAPLARSVAIGALMGATMLASPLTAARADTATNAAIQLAQAAAPQNPAAAGATETKGVTVEQRIKDLHAALKITSDQDSKWNEVAQDMSKMPPPWTS
jgi:protein CpxP